MIRSNKYTLVLKLAIVCTLFFGIYPIFHTENASAIDPKKELIQSENNIIFLDTCNGEGKKEESCAPASGNNITWIGDSYSVGAKNQILEKFSGVDIGSDSDPYIHCSKHIAMGDSDTDMDTCSRAGLSGLDLAKKIKDAGKMRPFLVFALATNDPGSDKGAYIKHFENLLTTVGDDTHVILVTTKTTDGENYDGVNDAMRDTANKYSNVSVADWAKSDKWKAEFFGDGVHPFNGGGIDAWLNVIQESLPGSCEDSGSVKALQDKVLELAWPENTHGTDRKPEYAKVVEKYKNGEIKDSDGTPYSYVGGCDGVDCGAWVSILMRESGWDPDYNSGGGPTSHQLQYLKNSDKWESLNALGTSIPEDQLKPGDVAVNDGHTYAYVGEIAGFSSHIASASLCNRAPTAGGEAPGDGSYYWFRKKGSGDSGKSSDSGSTSSSTSTSSSNSTSSGTFSAENLLRSDNNKIYDGSREIWTEEEAKKAEEFYPLYKKAADEVGIPWAFLAVVHRLETGQERANPSNGQGLFQDFEGQGVHADLYSPGVEVDDNNFIEQAKIAAEAAKDKGMTTDSDDGVIKRAFFAYNGTAGVYIQQAKNLGFSDEEARNGEGSPYVMNYADEKRNPEKNGANWGQIKVDLGPIEYPANTSHIGAFVMYAAIAGFSPTPAGSDDQCCDNPKKTQTNTGNFTKYTDLTDADIRDLAEMAVAENGVSIEAVKIELSIMANLYEKNGNNEGLMKYLARQPRVNNGWFSTYYLINGSTDTTTHTGGTLNITEEHTQAVNDVFVNGNRTVPVEIDEHDYIGDIVSAKNGSTDVTSKHSEWKRGVTVIHNNSDSTYTFWGWMGGEIDVGDPMGYIDGDPQEISTPTNNTTTGNNSVTCCDNGGDGTGEAAEAIAKNAINMSWPIQEGSDKGKCKTLSGDLINYTFGDTSCGYNPRELYEQAVAQYKIPHISTGGYEGCKDSTYCDCGMFVWTVLAATFPNEFTNDYKFNPNTGLGGEFTMHLQNSSDWEEIPNDGTEKNLKPGDIMQAGGHRMIYVGEYGGEYGTLAHASAGTRSGEVGPFYTRSEFRIFRRKGGTGNIYRGNGGGSSSSSNSNTSSSDDGVCPDTGSIGPNGLTEEQAARFLAHYSQNYKDVTYNFFSNTGDSRFSGGWNGGGSVNGCSIEDQCSGLSTFFIDTFTKNGKIGYHGSGDIHGLLDAKGVQQIPGPEVFSVFDSIAPAHTGLVVGKTDDGRFIYIHLNGTTCHGINYSPLNDIPEPASKDIKVEDYIENWGGASTHPGIITYDSTGISGKPVVYYKLDVDKEALSKFIGGS